MSDDENYEDEVSVNESDDEVEDLVVDAENDEDEIDLEKDETDEKIEEIDDDENEGDDEENDDESDTTSLYEMQGGKTSSKKTKTLENTSTNENKEYDEEYDDDEDDDEDDDPYYLQKFNSEINRNYLEEAHPECIANNYDEIMALTTVVRDSNNNIVDPLHKTLPYLTKYEKTRIQGYRAKQLNTGAKAFVRVPENIIDGYLIAEMELKQKRIPFILKRPIPGGGCEYWNLKDLEVIGF